MSQTGSTSSSTIPAASGAAPAKPLETKSKIDQVADLITERAASRDPPPNKAAPTHDAGRSGEKPAPRESGREVASADEYRPALELDAEDDVEGLSKQQQKTLRDFAAEHGVSVKALMGLIATDPGESDEPVSLGQLKDHWKEHRNYRQQRDEFEDWRETSQNEITVARRQVQDVFERIAGVVPPQTLARVFADAEYEHAESVRQQKAQALEYFPEWHDPEAMARDRDRLVDLARTYGFSRQDVGNIQDARIVKFMMDAMKVKERYERLKNGGLRDRPKPSTEAPSRKGHRPSLDERAKTLAAKGDKDAAIALIVQGALDK